MLIVSKVDNLIRELKDHFSFSMMNPKDQRDKCEDMISTFRLNNSLTADDDIFGFTSLEDMFCSLKNVMSFMLFTPTKLAQVLEYIMDGIVENIALSLECLYIFISIFPKVSIKLIDRYEYFLLYGKY